MMRLNIHGAGGEVGRSCLVLETGSNKIMMDCGIKLSDETEYPLNPESVVDADVVFISHAHLDHTGYLPIMYNKGMRCPIIMTAGTGAITRILLKDSYNIERMEHLRMNYTKDDLFGVQGLFQNVRYNIWHEQGIVRYKFLDAGHIPGSAVVLLEINGKRIMYTGDINTNDTYLLKGANIECEPIDALIMETTYGDRNHPDRKVQEREFKEVIQKTVGRGGSVIIPVFAVGRAQEIIMMIANENFGVPIYLDGMAKTVTKAMLKTERFLRDAKALRKAMNKVRVVRGRRERINIVHEQSIFVTTSGMLEGGPILDYLKYLWHDVRSTLLLTGYQSENTNGRLLLESQSIFIDGFRTKVKCEMHHYDFSAHAGQKGLISLVGLTKPRKVILVHGDPESSEAFSKLVDVPVFKPITGEYCEI